MSNNTSFQTKDNAEAGKGLYLELPLGFTIFELSLQIVIGVFGAIGNAIVCVTIIKRPQVLSAMNQYLLSLAVADLGVLLFHLPLTVLRAQFPYEWVLGEFVCLYISPCSEVFFAASIWSITVIAVERYANIAWKKLRIGGTQSLKRSRLIIITIWVISFATASVPVYRYRKYNSEQRRCYSELSITFTQAFYTLGVILQYVLPLSIIGFCYQRIGKKVAERSRKFEEETAKPSRVRESSSMVNTKAILQQTKKTQRILKPLVILFALTMLPLSIFQLAVAYWGDKLFYQSYVNLLITVVSVCTFTNSAADPLVYCIVSKEFRSEAKSLLPCCFRRRFEVQKQRQSTLGRTQKPVGTTETLLSEQFETKL